MSHTIESAVKDYLTIRDEKDRLKRAYEEKVAKLDAIAAKIEAFILSKSAETGVTSFKTPLGTAGVRPQLRANIGDRDALRSWVVETGNLEVFQSRLSTTVIKEFMEANGAPPPGVATSFENVVSVTRPRA